MHPSLAWVWNWGPWGAAHGLACSPCLPHRASGSHAAPPGTKCLFMVGEGVRIDVALGDGHIDKQ